MTTTYTQEPTYIAAYAVEARKRGYAIARKQKTQAKCLTCGRVRTVSMGCAERPSKGCVKCSHLKSPTNEHLDVADAVARELGTSRTEMFQRKGGNAWKPGTLRRGRLAGLRKAYWIALRSRPLFADISTKSIGRMDGVPHSTIQTAFAKENAHAKA